MKCESTLRRLMLLLAITICISQADGQTPITTERAAPRDQAALEAVSRALGEMGGSQKWATVADTKTTGTCTAPERQGGETTKFRWTVDGGEFRYETDLDGGGPVFLSGHGRPSVARDSGSSRMLPEYKDRLLPYHLPAVTLQSALSNPRFGMRLVDRKALSGIPAVHVQITEYVSISKLQGSDEDWWFDSANGLPLRVTYLLPTMTNSFYSRFSWDFEAWTTQSGLVVPSKINQLMDEQIGLQHCNVLEVKTNSKPAAQLFDAR